jgi:hypothetical protein
MPVSQIYVQNLGEIRAYLRKMEPSLLPEMRREMKAAVDQTVVPAAKSRVPKRSGRAAGTIKSRAGGNRVYVVGGGRSAPYYPWLDFGGTLRKVGRRRNTQSRPFIKKGRYIWPAIDAQLPAMTVRVERGIGRVLDRLS